MKQDMRTDTDLYEIFEQNFNSLSTKQILTDKWIATNLNIHNYDSYTLIYYTKNINIFIQIKEL